MYILKALDSFTAFNSSLDTDLEIHLIRLIYKTSKSINWWQNSGIHFKLLKAICQSHNNYELYSVTQYLFLRPYLNINNQEPLIIKLFNENRLPYDWVEKMANINFVKYRSCYRCAANRKSNIEKHCVIFLWKMQIIIYHKQFWVFLFKYRFKLAKDHKMLFPVNFSENQRYNRPSTKIASAVFLSALPIKLDKMGQIDILTPVFFKNRKNAEFSTN